MHRIGIDLGGTKIELILTSDNPMEVLHRSRVETVRTSYEGLLNQLAGLVDSVRHLASTNPLVGIGAPGCVDPRTGDVGSSNLPTLCFQALQEDVAERVELPVHVVNDANCFTLSEALYGAGQAYRMVLGIILGTGMGGGLVLDGRICFGSQGITGEWGHVIYDPNGPLCYCGRKGCQELYLSGTGIQRMYREQTGREFDVREIHKAWLGGKDRAAGAVMEIFLEVFSQAMANLVMCIDPDVIVLGGGVSNLPDLYEEGLRRTSVQVFGGRLTVQIVPNQLGDSSGVYGAAAVAHTNGT